MDKSKERIKMCEKAVEIQAHLQCQDQLQEMLLEHFETDTYTLHTVFNEFIESYYTDRTYPCEMFKSFEQLWLAFVMKELYSKRWNGEDWVDI